MAVFIKEEVIIEETETEPYLEQVQYIRLDIEHDSKIWLTFSGILLMNRIGLY